MAELDTTAVAVAVELLVMEHLELADQNIQTLVLETREDIVQLKDFQAVVDPLTLEALEALEALEHLTLSLEHHLYTLQVAEAEHTAVPEDREVLVA